MSLCFSVALVASVRAWLSGLVVLSSWRISEFTFSVGEREVVVDLLLRVHLVVLVAFVHHFLSEVVAARCPLGFDAVAVGHGVGWAIGIFQKLFVLGKSPLGLRGVKRGSCIEGWVESSSVLVVLVQNKTLQFVNALVAVPFLQQVLQVFALHPACYHLLVRSVGVVARRTLEKKGVVVGFVDSWLQFGHFLILFAQHALCLHSLLHYQTLIPFLVNLFIPSIFVCFYWVSVYISYAIISSTTFFWS